MRTKRVFHRRIDEQACSTGFTIVELAVVIAMTAILTALLLPALSSAKEKTRRALCKSNLNQLDMVCHIYADDNSDVLPSAADNDGNYHSVRLSDTTFSNLVNNYAGNSNIFYCPNLVFNSGPDGLVTHDKYGYIIGYSYMATDVQNTTKGVDTGGLQPQKLSVALQTNVLFADANYWSPNPSAGYGPGTRLAPHTSSGGAMSEVLPGALPPPGATNSASLGAMGGNVLLYNNAVFWRSISAMHTYSTSSQNDAFGNY